MAIYNEKEHIQFLFLLYTSRSGSTMFSRLLDSHSLDIVVMPEFFLIQFLLASGENFIKSINAQQLLNFIKQDRQLKNLHLCDEDLVEICQKSVQKGGRALIENIVYCYVSKRGVTPKIVVIKNGGVLFLLKRLLTLFPDAKFLHIFRDPRAVVNSRIHSYTPYFGKERMGRGDIVFSARDWLRYMRSIHEGKNNGMQCIEIRYEKLCERPIENIKKIITNIGGTYIDDIQNTPKKTLEVGETEKQMHKLVYKRPDIKRIEAWKTELKTWQGVTIERIVGPKLEEYGYKNWFLQKSNKFERSVYFFQASVIHYWKSLRFYCKRLVYFKKGGVLLRHLKLFMAIRMERISKNKNPKKR